MINLKSAGSPFSVLRSPFSVLRSPFSVLRSPLHHCRKNLLILIILTIILSLFAACSNGSTSTKQIDTWKGIPVYLDGGTTAGWTSVRGELDSWWPADSGMQNNFKNKVKRINITSGNAVTPYPFSGTTLNIGGEATMSEIGPVVAPLLALLQPSNSVYLTQFKDGNATVSINTIILC